MKIIILAAGKGLEIDGINKALLKDPKSNKTILDEYVEMFDGDEVTVVVGYNAINIMMQYPQLNYIYNHDWRITTNSYSAFLALSDDPCIIISADFFMDKEIINRLKNGEEDNIVVVKNTSNRSVNALNCSVADGKISLIYQGLMKYSDPEAIGIYKLTNRELLRKTKYNCSQYPNLSFGQNIPLGVADLKIDVIDGFKLIEINTPLDYINFIKNN